MLHTAQGGCEKSGNRVGNTCIIYKVWILRYTSIHVFCIGGGSSTACWQVVASPSVYLIRGLVVVDVVLVIWSYNEKVASTILEGTDLKKTGLRRKIGM